MAPEVGPQARARFANAAARFNAWGAQAVERFRDFTQKIPYLRQEIRPENIVGLALMPQGISVATVQRVGAARPRLTRCDFHPLSRQADPGIALRTLMLQGGIDHASYRLVLSPEEYQLHLVESPDVPDSELREAVRWRVRDLIDFPVDEAAIDVFDMPQQAGPREKGGRMMCVVVARMPVIAQKAALVNRSGGQLDVIDITDLALRNLLMLAAPDGRGVALLYVDSTYSMILITCGDTLYLSRRIWIGQQEIAALAGRDPQGEEFRRVADALAMELLRSLEYYETHFSRPSVESLFVAPIGAAEAALQAHLSRAIGVEVQALDLNRLLDVPGALAPDMQSRALLAIGGALRVERSTL